MDVASASANPERPTDDPQADSLVSSCWWGLDHPESCPSGSYLDEVMRVGRVFFKPKDSSYQDMAKVKKFVRGFPFKYRLVDKEFKPRKWVRHAFKRTDGLTIEKWRQADDTEEVEFPGYGERKVDDMISVLESLTHSEFDAMNNGKYIWSWDETMYLIEMARKYNFRYVLISDRYKFQDKPRRSVLEVKARINYIYDSICILRKQPELAMDYSPFEDKYNRMAIKTYLNRDPENVARIDELHEKMNAFQMHLYKKKAEMDAAASAAASAAAVAVSTGAGLLTSARSSSSHPPSRMPSVTRAVAGRSNTEIVTDWNKKLEAALDTSMLRFFNSQAVGPHMQSQEYRLLSNVNVKKKANIDFAIDLLESQVGVTHTTFTEGINEQYTKLSLLINQVTELKNVYNAAYAEMVALNNELKDKTGQEEDISDVPPMRRTFDNGQPSLLAHIESPNNPNAVVTRRR